MTITIHGTITVPEVKEGQRYTHRTDGDCTVIHNDHVGHVKVILHRDWSDRIYRIREFDGFWLSKFEEAYSSTAIIFRDMDAYLVWPTGRDVPEWAWVIAKDGNKAIVSFGQYENALLISL